MGGETKRDFLNKTKLEFYNEVKKYQSTLKPTKEIEGFASNAIVGEKGYPDIKVHSISNPTKEGHYFKNAETVKKDYNEIIKMKAQNILGSTAYANIRKTDEKIKEELRDIYKSKKEVEFTSEFEKELKFDKVQLNNITGILGAKNELKRLETNQNPTSSKEIDKFVDNDIKAKEAIIRLYEQGTNEHQIINLLALGSFGLASNRKLVPSRWAISAYDQTIENHLFEKLKKYPIIKNYEVYSFADKGNHFVIILMPDNIEGEFIETWPGAMAQDLYDEENKLDNKEPATAGGYYAQKIAVFERLNERKKQASVLNIRYIKDYDLPLGVVFVRESVREAMKKKVFEAPTLNDVKKFIKENYKQHHDVIDISKLLTRKRKQQKLNSFL